ncbi:Dihydropteroate synthase [Auriscalpium vulgare]|uniref:Dihydropteroate synthase n=1 Tax=Auriscalpium vulgare TaxID=40419 RepID=A0ACB8RRJ0_9AGAM|nr:Dihydropteroate synthase [Auriscalpium vulgare]
MARNMSTLSSRLRQQDSGHAHRDIVRVRNLLLTVPVGDGAQWPSDSAPVRQPVRVSLSIPHDLKGAAAGDDISQSLNYGSLSRTVLKSLEVEGCPRFLSLESLLGHVFKTCFDAFAAIQQMSIKLVKPRATPYADGVGILSTRSRDGSYLAHDCYFIEQLACNLIVGLNPCEREDKQVVHFDVDVARLPQSEDTFNFRGLAKAIRQNAEDSSFISLESLASLVAQTTLKHAARNSDVVTVRAAKTKALVFAEAAEVEIVRTIEDYPSRSHDLSREHTSFRTSSVSPLGLAALLDRADAATPTFHTVAIALGSNLGDRFANVEHALRLLEQPMLFITGDDTQSPSEPYITVVDTSFMYETAPMYVTEQPSFVNCACMIETNLLPVTLLRVLKGVETAVGRVPTTRNGPRAVDLDVILFNDDIIDTRPETERSTLDNLNGQLVVPHPRMPERAFVLRPLADMIPDNVHPTSKKTVKQLLSDVLAAAPPGSHPMHKVIPFPRYPHVAAPYTAPEEATIVPPTTAYWKVHLDAASPPRKTRIMATLNATPDSFSDGATHNTLDTALAYAQRSVGAGADIVDIGGYSTRPGAAYVSPEDEISRVVPVIQRIRSSPDGSTRGVLISVDTFRPEVARAAVLAGANCINDVYAFTGPDYPLTPASANYFAQMREVARELAVPVVVMHSRGDAGANKDYSAYGYSQLDAVLEGIAQELGEKVDLIVKGAGGVRRWLVVVDPGVGFSKTLESNLQVLRHASKITAETLPLSASSSVAGSRNPLRGYPQLIGASRKSFLGAILSESDPDGSYRGRNTEPKERGWATAAAVAHAVKEGVAVVRVHDVMELGDVVRVADALQSQY